MHTSGNAIVAWPSFREWRGRVLGAPFVLAACSPAGVFGCEACLAAGVLAVLATFVAFVPLTALALNGGQAVRSDRDAPPLTPLAYFGLLLLWTATIWIAAAVLHQ